MSASTDFLVPPAQRLIQNLLRTLHWPLLVGLLLSAVLLTTILQTINRKSMQKNDE